MAGPCPKDDDGLHDFDGDPPRCRRCGEYKAPIPTPERNRRDLGVELPGIATEPPLTLEALRRVVRDELDSRLLKTEKLIRELRAAIRRHDNRFDLVDSRLTVIDDNGQALMERTNAVEEALDVESRESGGTIGERLSRLEIEIESINTKLKAG